METKISGREGVYLGTGTGRYGRMGRGMLKYLAYSLETDGFGF